VQSATVLPTFAEAFRFWLKLGFISFGGPAGQIAIMQTELVERKRWIDQARFLHALNYCMLLPGPEAQQLAIYIGWLLHRTAGGIVAGVLFVLPSVFILWTLSFIYVRFGNVPWIAAIFYGLKPAVLAIVAAAVIRIGRKALRTRLMWGLAAAAFIAIYFFRVPFPLIIIAAGAIGFLTNRAPAEAEVKSERVGLRRTIAVFCTWLAVWWVPLLSLGAVLGWNHTVFREAVFFVKAAVLTFGGAYAVLPYVSQQAVDTYHWLAPGQMLDGLGLAETTPGPLIMVLQFVGFVGAWNQPGNLSPLLAATLGALATTWATFAPCFLWIFAGAPYIERLRNNSALTAALSTVTAAVVGVILNLAVWFALHVIFPANAGVEWFAVVLALIAFIGMLRWKWDVIPVVVGSGVVGLLHLVIAR
jgi:chromate transporter